MTSTGCQVDVRWSGPSSSERPSERPSSGASRPAERDVAKARDDLAALRVAPEGDGDGYSRERFGGRWKDIDRNGCDQRNDILARDLRQVRKRDDCVVTSGRLHDPYSGRDIAFDRSKPAEVQIDHVYPLALAWRMGASRWSADRRERFANDPDNLLAVWGVPNRQKSDSGPAEWQPAAAFRCEYGIRYIAVARKYALPVTRADRDALRGFLDRC
ncbi:HNH endonuclease family protein [Actinomadura keratinilytica]|uniref:HNH endonuclease family protein n=1 Tax=Actinomadura keratinilytica TaxID=547461 RepID=UPI0031E859BC